MKIFLIGYMASGKSTLGKQLAQKLNCTFIDTDNLIIKQEGHTCSEIIKTKGETYFRALEQNTLQKICSTNQQAVIATGGGMPCFHDNIEQMNASGKTFFLNWTPKALLERLMTTNISTRPMLQGKTNNELLELINTQLAKRKPHYTMASVSINCDGLNDCEIINKIICQL